MYAAWFWRWRCAGATARDGGAEGGINLDYTSFVFAQGVPIVIKQNGAITSVYDESGNLLSGNTDVSNCAIYGGWYHQSGQAHTSSTSITMESGTVSDLMGGGFDGTLNGNTNVVLKNGTVSGAIYSGGNGEDLNGDTNVTIEGGTVAGLPEAL